MPVENNRILRNLISLSGDTGVSLANFDLGTAPATPNDNVIAHNKVDGSVVDGIHVFDGADNLFQKNKITNSGGTDAVDDTSGGGTAGTANTWKKNTCSTSIPAGLC